MSDANALPPEGQLREELRALGLGPIAPSDQVVAGMRRDLTEHIANIELRTDLTQTVPSVRLDEVTAKRIEARLEEHIEQHHGSTHRGVPRTNRMAPWKRVAGVAAAVLAVAIVGFMVRPDTDAEAAPMAELAAAVYALPDEPFEGSRIERSLTAEAIDDSMLPLQHGVEIEVPVRFVQEQFIEYSENGSVRIASTFTEAVPLIEVDAETANAVATFYRVGETDVVVVPAEAAKTERFDLAGDAHAVQVRVNTYLANFGDPDVPYVAQLFAFVASTFNSQLTTASERATLIEILATTEDVRSYRRGDLTVASTSYIDRGYGAVQQSLLFDRDGWLIEDLTVSEAGIAALNLGAGGTVSRVSSPPPVFR